MTWNEYWGRKTAATPDLIDKESMTIKVSVFKAEIKKAYMAGRTDPHPSQKSEDARSLFDSGLFGRLP